MHSLAMLQKLNEKAVRTAPQPEHMDLEHACRLVETAIRQLGGDHAVEVVVRQKEDALPCDYVWMRPRNWSRDQWSRGTNLFESIQKINNVVKRLNLPSPTSEGCRPGKVQTRSGKSVRGREG